MTGVTGLQANQEMLDVVGNNLANMNTIGFKSQSINFSDLIYQTLSAGGGTNAAQASGTDPIQIGLGVGTRASAPTRRRGACNRPAALDVAIQGGGYFVLKNPTGASVYTRGSFGIDSKGFLVDPSTGFRVQRTGTVGDPSPTATGFQVPGNDDIQIPQDTTIPGRPTDKVTIQGNLDSSDKGPVAQAITTAAPLTAGGAAAAPPRCSTTSTPTPPTTSPATFSTSAEPTRPEPPSTSRSPSTAPPRSAISSTRSTRAFRFDGDARSDRQHRGDQQRDGEVEPQPDDRQQHRRHRADRSRAPSTVTTPAQTAPPSTAASRSTTPGGRPRSLVHLPEASHGTWNMTASMMRDGTLTQNTVTGIAFNNDGSFQQVNGASGVSVVAQFAGETSSQAIAFNFGSPGGFCGLTQVGGGSSAAATGQTGYAAGSLTDVTIDQDGVINGNFSNGQTLQIAQLGIASSRQPGRPQPHRQQLLQLDHGIGPRGSPRAKPAATGRSSKRCSRSRTSTCRWNSRA